MEAIVVLGIVLGVGIWWSCSTCPQSIRNTRPTRQQVLLREPVVIGPGRQTLNTRPARQRLPPQEPVVIGPGRQDLFLLLVAQGGILFRDRIDFPCRSRSLLSGDGVRPNSRNRSGNHAFGRGSPAAGEGRDHPQPGGADPTPSVVSFTESGEVLVGAAALRRAVEDRAARSIPSSGCWAGSATRFRCSRIEQPTRSCSTARGRSGPRRWPALHAGGDPGVPSGQAQERGGSVSGSAGPASLVTGRRRSPRFSARRC